MITIVLGAAFGAGLVALAYGLRPPRPALADVIASLDATPGTSAETGASHEETEWATRLGRKAVPLVRALGFPTATLRADLAVCGTDVEKHLAGKATCTVAGLLTPWIALALVRFGAGIDIGWWMPLSGSLVLAAVLFFLPDISVRKQAAERRHQIRHTLTLILDLTVIALAGGAGIQQALADAVQSPRGWAASKLRHALHVAQLTRTSPWQHLGDLGQHLGVSDLTELAATLNLAGTEGAKVRASLAAKARAMRRRRLSEADGAAQAATEQMSLPVVLLFAAFLLLIGYPALAHVLTMT
ncbi:type II secretion system F family protein [Streptomyces sp. NPDC094472]|uniref:type II secretion system F family protein n=1 Tax=Streptomyces sp. NPDC094472 TaxID=3155080 RepID=UPI00331D614F